MWQQCFEAVSNPEGPYYHAGMVMLPEYTQRMFNL
jgi:hypothetical protein